MGILETVIKYNREEGIEIGEKIGRALEKVTFNLLRQIDLLKKFKDRNFTLLDLSEMVNQEIAFVNDFKNAYTDKKYHQLLIAIEKSKQLKDLEVLHKFLIKRMFTYGFTKPVLANYFKKKKKEIEEILKNID